MSVFLNHSSSYYHLFFHPVSLIEPGAYLLVRLFGQWDPGLCLSLPGQLWRQRCVLAHVAFMWVLESVFAFSRWCSRLFRDRAFSLPLLSFGMSYCFLKTWVLCLFISYNKTFLDWLIPLMALRFPLFLYLLYFLSCEFGASFNSSFFISWIHMAFVVTRHIR